MRGERSHFRCLSAALCHYFHCHPVPCQAPPVLNDYLIPLCGGKGFHIFTSGNWFGEIDSTCVINGRLHSWAGTCMARASHSLCSVGHDRELECCSGYISAWASLWCELTGCAISIPGLMVRSVRSCRLLISHSCPSSLGPERGL